MIYNNNIPSSEGIKRRWKGGGGMKKGSWSWLLWAATETTPKEREEAGSFPPALGFSSFLWDYMGERDREDEQGERAGVGKYL
jgi:hypothetical protein